MSALHPFWWAALGACFTWVLAIFGCIVWFFCDATAVEDDSEPETTGDRTAS